MNRRKAIAGILLLGGAAAAGTAGVTYRRLSRTPDLEQLDMHRELISELAETLIPETDTPGAKSAGVGDCIITLVKDCTPKKAQNRFINGLLDVADHCRSKYGKTFMECNASQRSEVMTHIEKQGKPLPGILGKVSGKIMGDDFYATFKKYAIIGYCTSQQGATKEMAYEYIPGRFKGCVPLQPGQKCWATD